MKTAHILGESGQDGAYLARFLLSKNYAVHGTSRDAGRHDFSRLRTLGIRERVVTHTVSETGEALPAVIETLRPDEIYNLAGLSSVSRSFTDPQAAWTSIADAQIRLLDVVRAIVPAARVYHSASSECFGSLALNSAADERTPFAPLSPYAAAKVAAHNATAEFRSAHSLYACSGIVFNHESPLRGEPFVTHKIVSAASAIAAGDASGQLALGDLSVSRDWGYAAEYVEAMWTMLQQPEPGDFVIATGESHTVEELAAAVFAEFGLDHRQHVVVEETFRRRAELRYSRGNPARAREVLGWEAQTKFGALVRLLSEAARRASSAARARQ